MLLFVSYLVFIVLLFVIVYCLFIDYCAIVFYCVLFVCLFDRCICLTCFQHQRQCPFWAPEGTVCTHLNQSIMSVDVDVHVHVAIGNVIFSLCVICKSKFFVTILKEIRPAEVSFEGDPPLLNFFGTNLIRRSCWNLSGLRNWVLKSFAKSKEGGVWLESGDWQSGTCWSRRWSEHSSDLSLTLVRALNVS